MQASVLRGSSSNLRYFMPILRTWGPKLSVSARAHCWDRWGRDLRRWDVMLRQASSVRSLLRHCLPSVAAIPVPPFLLGQHPWTSSVSHPQPRQLARHNADFAMHSRTNPAARQFLSRSQSCDVFLPTMTDVELPLSRPGRNPSPSSNLRTHDQRRKTELDLAPCLGSAGESWSVVCLCQWPCHALPGHRREKHRFETASQIPGAVLADVRPWCTKGGERRVQFCQRGAINMTSSSSMDPRKR